MFNRNNFEKIFIGGLFGAILATGYNFVQNIRKNKLANSKIEITDELNQEIGRLKEQIDNLKKERISFDKKNLFTSIFRMKNKDNLIIDSEIKYKEIKIKELEEKISEIRKCESIKMVRYVEADISNKVLMLENKAI